MKVLKKGSAGRYIRGSVLTLGNFDGLHLGHRKIIDRVIRRSRSLGVPAVVYTFDPHPLKVVAPAKSPPLLLDIKDKIRLMEASGVDCLVLARFTKGFAAKHPRAFVEEELHANGVREVWVGHDFSFGRGRTGTVEYLRELGAELGFRVVVVPAYMRSGAVVSSSRIRELIRDGDVKGASALLGRHYSIKGRVVKGRGVGGGIGYPTANLSVTSELIPADGVYAGFAVVDGTAHQAAINIGPSPTFGVGARRIEAHLPGFSGNIYGKKMEIDLVARLRGVIAFQSKEALIRRIERDVRRSRAILNKGMK
ncbi:MAG: bifunctional riboflavin kinase/FAD synthetase [Deltaproteobacteria bacterium]|nr:bifunctional riboflavin kinase/FAD synthetase [Deltaproteobacteria bacterium]